MAKQTPDFTNGMTFEAGAEAFAKGYEQMVATFKQQIETLVPNSTKNFDEFAAFGRGNVNAALQAGSIAAKGAQIIGEEIAAYNKKALDTGVANAKSLFGVKTVQEAVDLQTGFARAGFDELVAQSTKLGKLSAKVVEETQAPLNARINTAVETFSKPVTF